MRDINVRNASIYANLRGHKIDFEIRTTKNSANGLTLIIDGVKIIDLDCTSAGTLHDGRNFDDSEPLFELRQVKSNGCVSKIYYDEKRKIKLQ